jgi:NAD(P)-dependent dehydrogenase (short-subunit alcohol dehydrogenase family)
MAPRVWLITGCSSGFGRELVNEVLRRGDRAVATARRPDELRGAFTEGTDDNLLIERLDVTDNKSMCVGGSR